jgi:para-nitrobenzyl esterase
MRNLWFGAALAAVGLLCGRPAAAQVRIVSVTGGRVEGVLAASPLAKGLFQRAISESGGIDDAEDLSGLPKAQAEGARFLAQMGARDISAARALAAKEIVKMQNPARPFAVVVDGYVLPDSEYRLYQAGRFSDTPLLLGTNSDEGRLLAPPGATTPARFEAQIRAQFGSYADAILALYPHATDADADAEAEQAARDVVRDTLLAQPHLGLGASALSASALSEGRG